MKKGKNRNSKGRQKRVQTSKTYHKWEKFYFYFYFILILSYQKLGLDLFDGGLICGTVKPSSSHLLLLLTAVNVSFISLNPVCPPFCEKFNGVCKGGGACGTQVPVFDDENEFILYSKSVSANGSITSPLCKIKLNKEERS